MAHFTFKARKQNGELHKGEQDAKDRYDLYNIIRQSGEEVISVEEKKAVSIFSNIQLPFLNGIKMQEKINFSRILGSMIKAGLAMTQALAVMEKQGKNKTVKKIVAALTEEIRKGKTLSEAMVAYPKMFSPLMVAMVHAGEQSGTLTESLRIVTLQMDKNYTLQRRIKGAFMYPSVIFFAMILIGIILLTFVVPTLTKTFIELNLTLPKSTRFVIWISDMLKHHYFILIGVIALAWGLIYFIAKQPKGKSFLHKFVLKIPLIGFLIKEVNVARIARTLSSLVGSGVDLLESIRITSSIIQNVHYRKILDDAVIAVEKGDPLSKSFARNTDLCPIFLSEMISVGEETGKIGEMLIGVAVFYEEDVDQKTKDMSTIIEPFLMIIIGAAVGFFAISMITPMYSLVNTI